MNTTDPIPKKKPTPETEQLLYLLRNEPPISAASKLADFARQLEQQRDEARAQCDAVRVALDASAYVPLATAAKNYVSAYEDVVGEKLRAEELNDKLTAERDEARRERRLLRDAL